MKKPFIHRLAGISLGLTGLFAGLLALGSAAMAQETLIHEDFSGEVFEPSRYASEPEPKAKVEIRHVADGPDGVAADVLHLNDGEFLPSDGGSYRLFFPFPSQSGGRLITKSKIRIVKDPEGPNGNVDFRISLTGRDGGAYQAATYIRLRSVGDSAGWYVYDPAAQKPVKIPLSVTPGDWYLLEQEIDLDGQAYHWALRNLSHPSQEETASGKGQAFYQQTHNLGTLLVTSIARGGGFEIADLSVEKPAK